MSVIGLDIGTAGCKAILVGDDGRILSKTSRSYQMIVPQSGWAELDAREVWQSVKTVISETRDKAADNSMKAISVSSMGDSIIPCDENNIPVGNSILAFDTRNIQEAALFSEKLGRKRIFEITGQPVHPTYSIVKILWLQRNNPKIFQQAKKFFCYEDFITAQLCGEAVMSHSSAGRTMAFDINTLKWNDDLLALGRIDESRLAKPQASGSLAGKIKKEVADELGLSGDVRIITGGHDQPCGALGCGLPQGNYAMDSTGTVEVLLVTSNQPILTDEMLESTICFWPHVIERQYCACGQILTAGAAFRWFRDTFAELEIADASKQHKNAYDLITSQFSEEPTSVFFVPHLSGSGTPEFTPLAKGAMYGATLKTSRYDLAKSILEGICFELKINVDLLEKAGMKIDTLRCVGGAALSNVWMQIKADITGKGIEACKFVDQCPLGAAILAAFGVGIISNLNESETFVVRDSVLYDPIPKNQKIYERRFKDYHRFRSSVFSLYEQIT